MSKPGAPLFGPERPSSGRSSVPFASRVLEDASRRLAALAIVGLILGIFAVIVTAAELAEDQTPGARAAVHHVGLFLVTVSAGAYAAARSRASNQLKINIGLTYVFLAALGIAIAEFWAPPYPVFTGGLSWTAIWVVIFAVFIPSTPKKTALVAFASVSTLLVGFLVGQIRGLEQLQDPSRMVLPLVTGFLLAGFAVIPSIILSGMAGQIRKAKELGSYTLERKLGEGGMGEVWVGRHTLLKRPAAIKLIRPHQLDPQKSRLMLKRFEREAQSTALLGSPNSIRLYDFGLAEDGTFYYVMELLDGLDVYELIREHGAVPVERAVHILGQVCSSLAEAHSLGLVHRDIKPGNIFLCRRGLDVDVVKVLDFGLVKSQDEMANPDVTHTAQNTATGTPAYMSPEAARGVQELGPQSDLYALGCVAYWLLTGKMVFYSENPLELMMKHVQEEPVPPNDRADWEIPRELENVVLKLLEKAPQDRYQSAEDLRAALNAVPLKHRWTQDRAQEWWQNHRRRKPSYRDTK